MITFSDIYESMRKEKYSEQLQLLPKKFLVEVADYLIVEEPEDMSGL